MRQSIKRVPLTKFTRPCIQIGDSHLVMMWQQLHQYSATYIERRPTC